MKATYNLQKKELFINEIQNKELLNKEIFVFIQFYYNLLQKYELCWVWALVWVANKSIDNSEKNHLNLRSTVSKKKNDGENLNFFWIALGL